MHQFVTINVGGTEKWIFHRRQRRHICVQRPIYYYKPPPSLSNTKQLWAFLILDQTKEKLFSKNKKKIFFFFFWNLLKDNRVAENGMAPLGKLCRSSSTQKTDPKRNGAHHKPKQRQESVLPIVPKKKKKKQPINHVVFLFLHQKRQQNMSSN